MKNIEIEINPEHGITYFQFIRLLQDTGIIKKTTAPGFISIESVLDILKQYGHAIDTTELNANATVANAVSAIVESKKNA